jgi:hypothetical protein
MAISYAEQFVVDGVGASLILTSFAAGPEGCAGGASVAWQVDLAITSFAAPVENTLGAISFFLTLESDTYQGNFSLSPLTVGVDTIVSGRNAILGMIPEANIDSWASHLNLLTILPGKMELKPEDQYQFNKFDEILLQIFWEDTFWQNGIDQLQLYIPGD